MKTKSGGYRNRRRCCGTCDKIAHSQFALCNVLYQEENWRFKICDEFMDSWIMLEPLYMSMLVAVSIHRP